MSRSAVILLASLLPLLDASPGPAQGIYTMTDPPPGVGTARLSLTPYIGWRVPIAQHRRETVIVPGDLLPRAFEVETQPSGGGLAGVEADLHLFGAVGLNGALAFSNPDNRILSAETPNGALMQVPFRGPSLWFARAGISVRMPEPVPDERTYRPAAFLLLGPALVREEYGDVALALPNGDNRIESWALHMGARGVFPIGARGVYVLLGLENYATFWNPHDGELSRVERAMELQPGTLLNASLGANRTHVLAASFGISLRF